MMRSALTSARALAAVAHGQSGYFTAKQAKRAGYDYPHLGYHVSAGNFERVGHGLYRLAVIPRDDTDEFVRLALWSRDRRDRPQAVVSHASALALHDLGDLLPDAVHLTVPPTFRKPPPPGVVLHKARLRRTDVEDRAGFRATTPLRTLIDAAAGDTSQEQLGRAVADALTRGLVRRKTLEGALARSPHLTRLTTALGQVDQSDGR
jgi:predicted transcriptional regulator of viral defense system